MLSTPNLPSPTTTPSHPRDVQIAEIGLQTRVLRSRTWDRLKFEVEYGRRKGTTANTYLIQADQTALIDPPGESFTQQFLTELVQQVPLTSLDYIILGHVNPNRIATLMPLLEKAPRAQVVCSRPAANALKAACPDWLTRLQIVRSETTLDLGQGHQLQFLPIPTPRWPDGLATYDPATHILFTDKLFGVHLCGDPVFDEDWRPLEADRRYYFDCLHAPQAKQVEAALARFATVSARCYAPGHGPLIRYSLSRFRADYAQWCQQQVRELRVALLYASAYGNTAIIANALAQGLVAAGISVESVNCEFTDLDSLTPIIAHCDGFIIGSPTLGGHAPVQIQTALGVILSNAAKSKLAGVFGSYGWSGEAVDMLEQKLRDANYRFGFDPIRVRFSPDVATLRACEAAGHEFAQKLRKQKQQRTARQAVTETQTDRTAQAVGRIIGSLCIITTCQGDTHSGLLTAWISQASFSPPGIMVAIAADQFVDHLTHPDTPFVLNILKEGRPVRRHFSPRPSPGENPFGAVTYHLATNGCRILDEALSYLECQVQHWMPCGDHWLVYATVSQGDILDLTGVTAVAHRKSGSSY
jgi:flavorubredoxin/flavin reductase (DIM6/NTAB) family NADH-FMN oxidoreductase RutF